jgi:hypothetical protein
VQTEVHVHVDAQRLHKAVCHPNACIARAALLAIHVIGGSRRDLAVGALARRGSPTVDQESQSTMRKDKKSGKPAVQIKTTVPATKSKSKELSDAELDTVSGGAMSYHSASYSSS